MKLSIIIPIYNVSSYIPRCFDSIYSSGVDENQFEVIVINDGSTDNSLQVINEYCQKHMNLKMINKLNGGVSAARNDGMEQASGCYIMFVDPDDALCSNSLSLVIESINVTNDADVIFCRSFKNNEEEYHPWINIFKEEQCYSSHEIIDKGYLRGSVWGGLYKKSFIENNRIHFLEGVRNGEDTNFIFQILYYTNKTVFRKIKLYMIVGREDSASRLFTRTRILVMLDSVKQIHQLKIALSKVKGNQMVLQYMIYSPIANLVNDCFKTPGIRFRDLHKGQIDNYCDFDINENIVFLKLKMRILKNSFALFYFFSLVNNILRRK